MTTKKCKVCNERKGLKYFYAYPHTSNGKHWGKCRKCCNVLNQKRIQGRLKEGDTLEIARRIYHRMKERNRKFENNFDFTIEDVHNVIISGTCAITGTRFSRINQTKYVADPFKASPDRIDNSKGYTKENVRWICFWINRARQEYDVEFFYELVRSLKWG